MSSAYGVPETFDRTALLWRDWDPYPEIRPVPTEPTIRVPKMDDTERHTVWLARTDDGRLIGRYVYEDGEEYFHTCPPDKPWEAALWESPGAAVMDLWDDFGCRCTLRECELTVVREVPL